MHIRESYVSVMDLKNKEGEEEEGRREEEEEGEEKSPHSTMSISPDSTQASANLEGRTIARDELRIGRGLM